MTGGNRRGPPAGGRPRPVSRCSRPSHGRGIAGRRCTQLVLLAVHRNPPIEPSGFATTVGEGRAIASCGLKSTPYLHSGSRPVAPSSSAEAIKRCQLSRRLLRVLAPTCQSPVTGPLQKSPTTACTAARGRRNHVGARSNHGNRNTLRDEPSETCFSVHAATVSTPGIAAGAPT